MNPQSRLVLFFKASLCLFQRDTIYVFAQCCFWWSLPAGPANKFLGSPRLVPFSSTDLLWEVQERTYHCGQNHTYLFLFCRIIFGKNYRKLYSIKFLRRLISQCNDWRCFSVKGTNTSVAVAVFTRCCVGSNFCNITPSLYRFYVLGSILWNKFVSNGKHKQTL